MILFAEDSIDDAFLLKRAFRKLNAATTIEHLEEGDAVIALLSALSRDTNQNLKHPTLMILDLKMPRAGGFEVLRWRKENPFWLRLPTIVFSSSAQDRDVARAYELGANSYAVKPSTLEGYRKFAEALSAWWIGQNLVPGTEARECFSLAQGC